MWRWDIFCRVVDNFGDVGVCWRLARQLAAEHGATENGVTVRLWVDDLSALSQLCPDIATGTEQQRVDQIEVCRWPADFPQVEAADVVIEAFGCELPENYLAAMARRTVAPVWINLEYLSAEDWVEGCHRLPSLRTRCPIDKYFFFPGFTAKTGGLLKERGLFTARDAFDTAAANEFWQSIGVPARRDDELRVSMFCYANPALPDLLQHWATGRDQITVLATPGPASEQIAEWLGEPLLPGSPLRRSALMVFALPFLPQSQFDRLLWACDVNFVRGEDSFVRAQWALRPFVWQIYPQTDDAHLVKLDAFLARYLEGFSEAAAAASRRCWHAWNGQGDITTAWPAFAACREALARHAAGWATSLDRIGSLADNLVSFALEIRNPGKNRKASP